MITTWYTDFFLLSVVLVALDQYDAFLLLPNILHLSLPSMIGKQQLPVLTT